MLVRQTLASVAALLSSYGLLLLANGLFGTLIGLRTQIESFSTAVAGLVVAAYFLGLLAGGIQAVRVVAAVGHIRSFAAFASIMSVSALGIVLVIDDLAWAALRFVGGFCMAGMIVATESWLNERCTNETRGQVMAFYMITNYLAAGCGQFILPLGDPAGFELFCVASIIYSLALVPVLLTRASAPRPSPPERASLPDLWRLSPLGLIGATAAGVVNTNFQGLAPVFAYGKGFTVTQTSTFMAAGIVGGLLLQWPMGRLSDRVDRRTVLAGVALGTAAASFGVWLVTGADGGSFPGTIVLVAVYGGLSSTVYSLCAAHANDFAPSDKFAQTAGGLLIAYGLGASAGPVLTSSLMEMFGASTLFMVNTWVLGLLGVFGLYRMIRRAPKPKARQRPIVPSPGGQFTSGQLHASMRDQADRDLARMTGAVRDDERRRRPGGTRR
ncbi:MAG: MFS transporter [Chromatiales bacterium]|nr:MFS transporter [Chromatiales bacterium]